MHTGEGRYKLRLQVLIKVAGFFVGPEGGGRRFMRLLAELFDL
jgi:hypothetical protein